MTRHRPKKRIGRLHVIVNSDTGGRPSRSPIELTERALEGGADTIQYRNKGGSMRTMIEEGRAILHLCRTAGVPCIVNDRVDLCLAIDADGVHLGRDDMPLPIARQILGHAKVIGATVRDLAQLKIAEEESADYVGLGPIFPTSTKELPVEPFGLSRVREVSRGAEIPVIGIAGITLENCRSVIEAGAYGLAVIGAVATADDPSGTVRMFHHAIMDGNLRA